MDALTRLMHLPPLLSVCQINGGGSHDEIVNSHYGHVVREQELRFALSPESNGTDAMQDEFVAGVEIDVSSIVDDDAGNANALRYAAIALARTVSQLRAMEVKHAALEVKHAALVQSNAKRARHAAIEASDATGHQSRRVLRSDRRGASSSTPPHVTPSHRHIPASALAVIPPETSRAPLHPVVYVAVWDSISETVYRERLEAAERIVIT